MAVGQRPLERDSLVTRLVDEFGLLRVVADACTRAGVPGCEQMVAYCLVVLVGKDDPARRSSTGVVKRTYLLDPDAHDFAHQLAYWAGTIAGHLRRWAPAYEAIHEEADRYEIRTLRRLIRTDRGDDVVDRLADELAVVLTGGPRLDEMSLDHAREAEPAPGEYAFQRPLSRWVATAVGRKLEWYADPLDDRADELPGGDVRDDLEEVGELGDEVARALVARVAALGETRGLLAAAIARADEFEVGLARQRPTRDEDAAALVRVRADLVHVADELRREQRALTGMLAYVVLAMRSAPQLQRVTVLSLRVDTIEQAVIDAMAAAMRAIIDDELQPAPALVEKTRKVADRRLISRSRATALEELRAAPDRRGAALAPVARQLDDLPAIVADISSIAGFEQTKVSIVTTDRSAAAKELTTVDTLFGRAFRRYAMGMT